MIKLENISKTYEAKNGEKTLAVRNVDLKFNSTGMNFIIGKSGSGKTTLLNLISGLDKSDFGKIIIDGHNINNFNDKKADDFRNTYIGFIFQDFNMIDEYNVYENIILSSKLQNKKNNPLLADKLLKNLGILELKYRNINELSGGQKQRVAIARALIKEPKIIIADEPTGNLDSISGQEVIRILKEISKDKLVIIVTHDESQALLYGDRIINLKDGVVINDNQIVSLEKKELNLSYNIQRTKLSLFDSFKFGLLLLKSKKINLLITSLLVSLSLLFLSTSYTIGNYNVDEAQKKILNEQKNSSVEIKKYLYEGKYNYAQKESAEVFLSNSDSDYIKSKTSLKATNLYEITTKEEIIELFNLNIYVPDNILENVRYDMYTNYNYSIKIVEDIKFLDEDIYGKIPTNNNEIIISNYIANLMIKYGININSVVFYPKNYDDILSLNELFVFDTSKIVGIVEYDLVEYNSLNGEFDADGKASQKTITSAYDLYINAMNIYNMVYAKMGYINELQKKVDVSISSVLVKTNDNLKTNELIKNFPYDSKFAIYNSYSSDLEFYHYHINSFHYIINITSMILLIFSSILTCFFVYNSILKRKKEIGILRSLGAKKTDIIKIFLSEVLVLYATIVLFSIVLLKLAFNVLNATVFNINYLVSPFVVNFDIIRMLSIYVLLLLILSTIVPLIKIYKMKPIDAILKK